MTVHAVPTNPAGRIIDPEPLVRTSRTWTKWIGPLISVLILVAVTYQLRQMDIGRLAALLPQRAPFWFVLIAYYFAGPVSEWLIFRRIWSLPASGFPALLRKLVSNEILLGYLGEVYFYAWARRHAQITTAPFGAIKDVTILSALTGNLFTLVMVVLAAPFFGALHLGLSNAFIGSTAFVLLLSAAMLLLRKRLFTLPKRELWFVGAVHSARIVVMMVLAATAWHLLLPAVALSWWLLLGTLRQLLSRLPFLPNKDIVFAGLASFLVASDPDIGSSIALFSSLILGGHLIVGACVGLSELVRKGSEE